MTELKSDRWVFIVNPVAGNGFAATIAGEIRQRMNDRRINGEIVFTERYGHAAELSARYLEQGFRYIIGVGGDGTFNEISRPLVARKDAVAGLIPAGTGNDFIQILGFPDRLTAKEWDIFFECNTAPIDAGLCNGKIFMNGMGLGFDAQVAAENYAGPGVVKKGSSRKYIWHIVKTLLFFREKQVSFNGSGGSGYTDCFINTVANGRRFAGGFFLTPLAAADDGLLDVCMIRRLNLYHRFRLLLKVPHGSHITDSRVTYFKTGQLKLQFSEEVPFHLDGELFFGKEFDISVSHSALKVIYNPYGRHFLEKQNGV